MRWPCDVELTECGPDFSPDGLEAAGFDGKPEIYNEDNCSLVAVSYDDERFDIVPDACFKILRTWTIIDWCQYDPLIDPDFGRWEYLQVIKVNDQQEPTIEPCVDVTFCDDNAEYVDTLGTCVGEAILVQDISDACTDSADLIVEYKIDAFNDGSYDFTSSEYFQVTDDNPFAYDESNARDASGKYPLGTHRITWIVEDMCGNLMTCEYLFTIEDCKQPTPYCLTGIVTVVMPSVGEIEVWAVDLDAGSFDNCPGDLTFSFDSLGLEPGMTITCEDFRNAGAGSQLNIPVNVWVTDAAGNRDYCETMLVIQDPNGVCDTSTLKGSLAGDIATEDAEGVKNVNVELMTNLAGFPVYFLTQIDGKYAFSNLPMHKDYTLRPERNDDPMNGVSTLDIVKIQKHLLGIEYLNSSYKLIAADVNNSQGITARDLIELRKMILGYYTAFEQIEPNQRSWRFVQGDYVFPDPEEPFGFPEMILSSDLDGDVNGEDFMAVKVGDVNGSADPNGLVGIKIRTAGALNFRHGANGVG